MALPPLKKSHTGSVLCAIGVCLIGIFTSIKACSHEPTDAFPSDGKHSGGDTIDVAIEVSPVLYSLSSNSVEGLDYELVNTMSASWHRPVKFHPFASLAEALSFLAAGRYDIVVSNLPSSTEMKDNFSMTAPLYIDRQILVQHLPHPDSLPPIKSQLELAGDTVWITASSPFASRIQALADEIGDTIHIQHAGLYSSEQLFMLVALGEVPRAVISETVARSMSPDYPSTDISTPVSFSQFQSWAVNRHRQSLADSISAWIDVYRLTPEYSSLLKKYLK